jgi:protein CsiD
MNPIVQQKEPPMLQTQVQEESFVILAPTARPQDVAPDLSRSYEVHQHPVHPRLKHIDISPELLAAFFAHVRDIDVQNLQYVPFMRFILAGRLRQLVGDGFRQEICNLLVNRDHGGLTLGVQETTTCDEDYVKLATAVSHLVGPANFDGMSGSYFARFVVKHTVDSDTYLRQAYRTVTLHTDGAYVDDTTDWLLMMKIEERHAEGGESRLLHLDDWEDLAPFSRHALATHRFTFKAAASKNVDRPFQRQIFWRDRSGICISYIDQFVQPETLEEARYLFDLSQSLENSSAVRAPRLPVGDLIMLNNRYWMHGRAPFRKNELLHRELMRLRGAFSGRMDEYHPAPL